jgi:hypothetical protein
LSVIAGNPEIPGVVVGELAVDVMAFVVVELLGGSFVKLHRECRENIGLLSPLKCQDEMMLAVVSMLSWSRPLILLKIIGAVCIVSRVS